MFEFVGRKAIEDEEGIELCRRERCTTQGIHAISECSKKQIDTPDCPLCKSVLIQMPRKRVRCSACAWRGPVSEAKKAMRLHA